MVAGSPVFRTALADFLDFAGEAVLVGHNIAAFDMKFLYRDARRFWNRIPDNDYIDTLHMARQVLPQLAHHRLVDLAAHYGIATDGAHRALNDCRMNQQVFELMGRELAERNSTEPILKCPRCGGMLRKRSGRFGKFYGCESFPMCRYTENINK